MNLEKTKEGIVSGDIYQKYFLSFSPHAVEADSTVYSTLEHAYHAARYDDPKIIEYIRTAENPLLAWSRSQKHKREQRADFGGKKREVMKRLCRLKLQQHEDVKNALRVTGTARIVKHITEGPPPDGFWDDGTDGKGRNEAGKIWMELREELGRR